MSEKTPQELKAEMIEAQYAADLMAVMATRAGRNVMHGILAIRNPLIPSFDPDPHRQAYIAGAADAVKTILADVLMHAPGEYHVMMHEHIDDPAKREESADRLERMAGTITKSINRGNQQ